MRGHLTQSGEESIRLGNMIDHGLDEVYHGGGTTTLGAYRVTRTEGGFAQVFEKGQPDTTMQTRTIARTYLREKFGLSPNGGNAVPGNDVTPGEDIEMSAA